MQVHVVFLAACLAAAFTMPMKLLKVPKIYNALITTNQKLLPSEAFPASTGPVFEPIPFSGDPVLLNPEAFAMDDTHVEGEAPRPFSKDNKKPAPVVFYPRYNVYHQLPQSLFPYQNVYQPPPIVVPVQRSESQEPSAPESSESDQQSAAPAAPSPPSPVRTQGFGFVANNRPANADIPNVLPPPPPLGAPRPQEQSEDNDEPQ